MVPLPMSPRLMKTVSLLVAALAASALAVLAGCGAGERETGALPGATLERALGDVDRLAAQFPLPGGDPLSLPRDHAAKPAQFVESWVFAGLVNDPGGEALGFQLSFYRVALRADAAERGSAWGARDIVGARLAIEPAGARARAEARLSRAALGLAGTRTGPDSVWLEDWSFTVAQDGSFQLRGAADGAALALRLRLPAAPPTPIDGDLYRGYWWSGLHVDGTLDIDGRSRDVRGTAMLDRLWGRGLPAGRGQLALARLWIEVDDDTAIRCEQLRRRAGGGTPLVEGRTRPAALLAELELGLAPDDGGWRSIGGVSYPLEWALGIRPGADTWRLAPLSTAWPATNDAGWSGIVVGTGPAPRWALLELSNFSTR
jgi:predicted secreted hydrolase